ncbi:universal stress protein [Alkalilimnicola ehrlichii]|uniref:universal stress protein n=1 Tax=Alkalilimnicola ehrlichii TaxID=351052 RepID=UPI0015F29363|nr:universal stress protein [Alkalilimnicola ehrlichii]
MIANIVVPVDGSEHALRALDHASYLAKLADAKIHLLHITPPDPQQLLETTGYSNTARREAEASAASLKQAQEEDARDIIATARDKLPTDVAIKERVIPGEPADTIVDYVSDLKDPLIVMGSRGLSAPRDWLLGGVSRTVLDLAECPVTLVH